MFWEQFVPLIWWTLMMSVFFFRHRVIKPISKRKPKILLSFSIFARTTIFYSKQWCRSICFYWITKTSSCRPWSSLDRKCTPESIKREKIRYLMSETRHLISAFVLVCVHHINKICLHGFLNLNPPIKARKDSVWVHTELKFNVKCPNFKSFFSKLHSFWCQCDIIMASLCK